MPTPPPLTTSPIPTFPFHFLLSCAPHSSFSFCSFCLLSNCLLPSLFRLFEYRGRVSPVPRVVPVKRPRVGVPLVRRVKTLPVKLLARNASVLPTSNGNKQRCELSVCLSKSSVQVKFSLYVFLKGKSLENFQNYNKSTPLYFFSVYRKQKIVFLLHHKYTVLLISCKLRRYFIIVIMMVAIKDILSSRFL